MSNVTSVEDFAGLSDRDLDRLLTQLERDEQSASRRRTKLHARIDFIRSGGFASAEPGDDPLEELLTEERELSVERHDLHYRLDALKAERSKRQQQRRS
jgi:hypothetical protein